MNAIPVNVRRTDARNASDAVELDLDADLRRARWLAKLLDAEFSVFGVKFGLDAIAGLLPGVGDAASLLAGIYPIHVARKHGLGKDIEGRMIFNLAIDFFGGLIPVIGDLFDVAFKANLKNVALLAKAAEKRTRT